MRAGAVGALAVALLVGAFLLRVAYVDTTPDYVLRHDAVDYDVHARSIAQGEGFSKTHAHGRPTAFRPPGYPYFLGALYHVFKADREPVKDRVHVARIAQAFVGTALVALVGLVALQLWGSVAGLVALGLAAVYLPLILVGGAVMSEPLFDVFMVASLAAVLAYRQSRHRYAWALAAGVLAGLAALTRAQALILLFPLALAVWDGRPWRARAAVGPPLVLVVMALLTITPWTIRNARELHAFVPISTQFGSALAGTYNDLSRADTENPASWHGLRHVPDYAYLFNRVRETNEATLERELRSASLHYIGDHPTYVAKVAWWNTRRMLDLAGLRRSRATAATITIDHYWADRGILCFWIIAALALAGAFTSMARRAPWYVWAMPVLMFLSVVFLVVETPRYRTPIDPFLVLLATAAVVTAARRLLALRASSAGFPRAGGRWRAGPVGRTRSSDSASSV
jgi:4-amino-4-deoxy-L-arabinose transferase-like glycosyltransferase